MLPSLSHLSDYRYKQGVNVVIAVCFTSSTSTTYIPYLNLLYNMSNNDYILNRLLIFY